MINPQMKKNSFDHWFKTITFAIIALKLQTEF